MAGLAIALAAATWVAPWWRWPPRANLVLVPGAFALIVVAGRYGSVSGYSYSAYFVVVFAWVGLTQRPRTVLWLMPLATGAYLVPALEMAHPPPGAYSSAPVVLPVCLVVAETIARVVDRLHQAREQAAHRAELLHAVARAAAAMDHLDVGAVLATVVDSVVELGLELANFCLFDDRGEAYRVAHGQGLPPEYVNSIQPATVGLPGLVREAGKTVQVEDYSSLPTAVPVLRDLGVKTALGVPVWIGGRLVAVLAAGTIRSEHFGADDIEALELLADQAARALDSARRFDEVHRQAQSYQRAINVDELTGVGNRRQANELVDSMEPGDGLVLIDIDHFKDINDQGGHAYGDEVLSDLAGYLRTALREHDQVARFGGDEFVVVLRGHSEIFAAVAERLLAGWRARRPPATISAGLAVHSGRVPTTTLGEADVALYAAKRAGRDQLGLGPALRASESEGAGDRSVDDRESGPARGDPPG